MIPSVNNKRLHSDNRADGWLQCSQKGVLEHKTLPVDLTLVLLRHKTKVRVTLVSAL